MMDKTVFRFVVSGVMAVLTDGLSYLVLRQTISHSLAKGLSFVLGSVVAFVLGKTFTFNSRGSVTREIPKFITLYTLTLLANVSVHDGVMFLMGDAWHLPFLAATGTSTVLNYLGQKFFVFAGRSDAVHSTSNQ